MTQEHTAHDQSAGVPGSGNRGFLSTLADIIAAPQTAFATIRARGMALPMILLTLALNAGFWIWYFNAVDFAWFVDQTLAVMADNAAPAELETVRAFMKPTFVMLSTVISVVVFMLALYLLQAVYFNIVSNIGNHKIPFGRWFAFVAWINAPSLLLIPIMAMMMLLSDNGQIMQDQLNPLSLNNLYFHFDTGAKLKGVMDGLSPFALWAWALGIAGYRHWTQSGWMKAAVIASIPQIILFLVLYLVAPGNAG